MGLGKTVMILALICRGKESGQGKQSRQANGWLSKDTGALFDCFYENVVTVPFSWILNVCSFLHKLDLRTVKQP